MTNKLWGYAWECNGHPVISPDPECLQETQRIDCPRGAFPGEAFLYFRPDAAASLAIDQEYDITCKIYSREYGEPLTLDKTVVFKGYIPTFKSEPDERGYVGVTFHDKRYKLARRAIDREFNTVFLMTWDAGEEEYIQYNDPHVKADNVPYEWQEICDALFTAGTLPTVPLPVAPDEPMKNFHACGSIAEALERFLCGLGCSLVYDPFTGDMSIVLLSDNGDIAALEQARSEKRLIEEFEIKVVEHGTVLIKPADWYPIRIVEEKQVSFGAGAKSVFVSDWELADEDTKQVRTARQTEIVDAMQAWFKAEQDPFDETFYGVIEQVPCEDVSQVTWLLSTYEGADEEHGHKTRIQNRIRPLMWPIRVEHFYPPALRGSTTEDGLTTTAIDYVIYWKSLEGGAYEETDYRVKAISMVNDIDPLADIAMWATEHKWLAVRIC